MDSELIIRIDKYNEQMKSWRDYFVRNISKYNEPCWLDAFNKVRDKTIAEGKEILKEAAQYGYYMDANMQIVWSMGAALVAFMNKE